MEVGDWWWERTHPPAQWGERDVRARGLVAADAPVCGNLVLREMRGDDFALAEGLRRTHRDWLGPWEASVPPGFPTEVPSLAAHVRQTRRKVRAGEALPLGVWVDEHFVGQVNFFQIERGAAHCATIGYWIIPSHARCGLMTLALACALDAAFADLRLHRVEINIRPENRASLALVRRLGMREEGVRRRFIHVNGSWCDHRSFALTSEERPPGGFVRARARRGQ